MLTFDSGNIPYDGPLLDAPEESRALQAFGVGGMHGLDRIRTRKRVRAAGHRTCDHDRRTLQILEQHFRRLVAAAGALRHAGRSKLFSWVHIGLVS